jgi:hypothetical protein
MTLRRRLLAAVAIAALLAVVWHFYGGGKSPAGQHPMVSLSPNNFGELRSAFNAASGEVRVVLLLSPT